MSNWTISKTEADGIETITITRPAGDKPKSTACVSRTVKAGTIVAYQYARVNDDFELEVGEELKQFDELLDEEKALKKLHNIEPTTKFKILNIRTAEENTLGIPREVFAAVAVPIDRPLSQQ